MKTMHNSLFKALVVIAVLLTGSMSVAAQQTQDALYIYRNDGAFNAFFFDDIERIEYSKVDTAGVEQNDYVVQEVYAADSLFRIPISAIDSVSFVTPETVYKSDVKATTESDLWSYVIGSDSLHTLLIQSNTPAKLVPAVGDKIVTTKSRTYLPGGFYGKVLSVSNGTDGITIVCETPPLTELFDSWVCKVNAVGNSESNAPESRRGQESSAIVNVPLPTYSNNYSLPALSYALDDNFSLSGEGSLSYGVSSWLHLRAFVNVHWITGVNMDVMMRVENTSWFDLYVKGGITGQFDVPLNETITWIPDTPFFLETQAGISSAFTGEVELKVHRKNVQSGMGAIQYNEALFDDGPKMFNASVHDVSSESETTVTGKLTTTVGPYFNVDLTLIDKSIGAISMRYDAGAKVEAQAELKWEDLLLSSPQLLTAYMLSNPTAQYDMLNRDGSIKIGPFCTAKITLTVGKWAKDFPFFDINTPWTFTGGLVPKFENTSLKFNEETMVPTASVDLSRNTLVSNPVGFVAYYAKSGKRLGDELWMKKNYWRGNFKNYSMDLNKFGGGKEVRVYPMAKVFGYALMGSPYAKYTVPAEMKVTPEEVSVKAAGGESKLTVEDNLDRKEDTYERKVEFDFGGDDVEPWAKGSWSGDDYKLEIEKSADSAPRTAKVTITTFNEDESVKVQKTITLKQEAAAAEIDPNMQFLGKWTYESSREKYYVEYTFRADGTYYSKWDTPSKQSEEKGVFVVNSYKEPDDDKTAAEASVSYDLIDAEGKVYYSGTHNLKVLRVGQYRNGVFKDTGRRELQIGWNVYNKVEE